MPSLVVLSCVVAAAAACVPTKTPEPGIPAMKKCTEWPHASDADCTMMAECGWADTATITSASIKCFDDYQVIIVDNDPVTGMPRPAFIVYQTVCMNGVWYSKDSAAGTPQILDPGNMLNGPVRVACAFFR